MDRKERELDTSGRPDAAGVSREPTVSDPSEKIASLLAQGDELFDRSLYERAVHVWTRILFLERRNARALESIERAKRALAERHRIVEARLAEGKQRLDAGEALAARASVDAALALEPKNQDALQLAAKIEGSLPREREAPDSPRAPHPKATRLGLRLRVPGGSLPRPVASVSASRLKMAGFVLGAVLLIGSGALFLHLNWESILSDGAFARAGQRSPVEARVDVPVPDLSEIHYVNGARLFAKGRYREALVELGRVPRDSPLIEQARGLVLRIEERLLRGGIAPSDAGQGRSR